MTIFVRTAAAAILAAIALSGCGLNLTGAATSERGTPEKPLSLGTKAQVGPWHITVTEAKTGLAAGELGGVNPQLTYARIKVNVWLNAALGPDRPASQYPQVSLYNGTTEVASAGECEATNVKPLRPGMRWTRESDEATLCIAYDPAKAGPKPVVGIAAARTPSPMGPMVEKWQHDELGNPTYWATKR